MTSDLQQKKIAYNQANYDYKRRRITKDQLLKAKNEYETALRQSQRPDPTIRPRTREEQLEQRRLRQVTPQQQRELQSIRAGEARLERQQLYQQNQQYFKENPNILLKGEAVQKNIEQTKRRQLYRQNEEYFQKNPDLLETQQDRQNKQAEKELTEYSQQRAEQIMGETRRRQLEQKAEPVTITQTTQARSSPNKPLILIGKGTKSDYVYDEITGYTPKNVLGTMDFLAAGATADIAIAKPAITTTLATSKAPKAESGLIKAKDTIKTAIGSIKDYFSKTKVTQYGAVTERISSEKGMVDVTRSFGVLSKGKTNYKIQGLNVERYYPLQTEETTALTRSKGLYTIEQGKKGTAFKTKGTGITKVVDDGSQGFRLLTAETKNKAKKFVALFKSRINLEKQGLKTSSDVTETLKVPKSGNVLKATTESITGGKTAEIIKVERDSVSLTKFASRGSGVADPKSVKEFRSMYDEIYTDIPPIRKQALNNLEQNTKTSTISGLKTTSPPREILTISDDIVKSQMRTQAVNTGIKKSPQVFKLVGTTKKIVSTQKTRKAVTPKLAMRTQPKTTTRIIPTTKTENFVNVITSQVPKIITRTTPQVKTSPLTKAKPATKQLSGTLSKTATKTALATTPKLVSIYDVPLGFGITPKIPIPTQILLPPGPVPRIDLTEFSRNNMLRVPKQPGKLRRKYRPTVFSALTGFTGQEIKLGSLSGLGLRPLTRRK